MPCRLCRRIRPGSALPQVVLRRVVRLQLRPQVGIVVGFLVDDQQQGEAVEQEVAAAAGRVEDLDLSGVFLGPVRDQDRVPAAIPPGWRPRFRPSRRRRRISLAIRVRAIRRRRQSVPRRNDRPVDWQKSTSRGPASCPQPDRQGSPDSIFESSPQLGHPRVTAPIERANGMSESQGDAASSSRPTDLDDARPFDGGDCVVSGSSERREGHPSCRGGIPDRERLAHRGAVARELLAKKTSSGRRTM